MASRVYTAIAGSSLPSDPEDSELQLRIFKSRGKDDLSGQDAPMVLIRELQRRNQVGGKNHNLHFGISKIE
jgi:hypothetical protein